MTILTKDRKDIFALKDSLARVRDEIGAMNDASESVKQSFVRQTESVKTETKAIKDSLNGVTGALHEVTQKSEFNFDLVGLLLSQNIIASLHSKIESVVGFIDQTQAVSDQRLEGLSSVLSDAIGYIEKVEQLAKDTTSTDALKQSFGDTKKAIADLRNETKQGAKNINDKAAKHDSKIKELTTKLDSMGAQLREVKDHKPQIVQVKDADSSFTLQNRGIWTADAEGYKKGNIVRHASASWLCVRDTTETPSDQANDWALLARDGRGGGSPISPGAGATIDDNTASLTTTFSGVKIEQLTALTWTDYVTRGEYVETNGQVLTYTFQGETIFRFVPESPYVYAEDAFFADAGLTQLLAARV